MIDYSQPSFYRFDERTLQFIHFIKTKRGPYPRILDLGAGCGIIGIELANFFSSDLILIEKQKEFLPHIDSNLKTFFQGKSSLVLQQDIVTSSFIGTFDLIVSNMPFYFLGEGRLPQNLKRRDCHFIAKEDHKEWLKVGAQKLSPNGDFFLLFPSSPLWGDWDLLISFGKESIWKFKNKTKI